MNPDEATVRRVHDRIITIDAHLDIRNDFNASGNDAGTDTADQFDLPKLERGHLDVATVALFADPARRTPENVQAARQQVDVKLQALRSFVSAHPDRLEFARTTQDIERLHAAGKHAILLSFLNTLPLGSDITLLSKFYDDGVRVLGFTHAQNTAFADSSRPNAAFGDVSGEAGGLTDLGKKSVAELNRLGVIIDVSQLTPAGVSQVLALSKAPVIASHSALRSRVDVNRNLTNDELRGIAANGGVVHIVAFAAYLHESQQLKDDYASKVWGAFGLKAGVDDPKTRLDAATYQRFQDGYRAFSREEWRYATLADYVDAVDSAVRLIGIDHVGLSSDFNHGGGVTGYRSVADAPAVTRELLKRGYSEDEIRKLWGGNFLRVFGQVEAYAATQPRR